MTNPYQQQPPVPLPPPPPGDLQFEHAEPAENPGASGGAPAAAMACAACQRPITDWYFAAGDKVVCPVCREQIVAAQAGGSGFGRFMRALLFGVGAGLGGALIWYGVQKLTGYQVGLIAVVVGLMVGGAVRAGARGRGGLGYQFLAVVLTYLAIAIAFAPLLFEEAMKEQQAADAQPGEAPPAWFVAVFACALALVAPVAQAFTGGIIGALIVGFALWEAWRMNRKQELSLTGPYAVGQGVPPGGAPPYPPPGVMPPPPAHGA